MLRPLLLLAVLAATLMGLATPAGATVVGSSGATGYTSLWPGKCSYAPVWRTLYVGAPPPAIYAIDYRAGGGNDAQYVRYSVMLIDTNTGTVLQRTGYSGTAVAWDNSPAQFSGSTSFSARAPGDYRILFNIEWLNNAGGLLGRTYQRVDSYRYYESNTGPYGPYRSCAHI